MNPIVVVLILMVAACIIFWGAEPYWHYMQTFWDQHPGPRWAEPWVRYRRFQLTMAYGFATLLCILALLIIYEKFIL